MRVFHRFATSHQDLIHDLSYDYYGTRIATCSSDQSIKIWYSSPSLPHLFPSPLSSIIDHHERDLVDNEWKLSASWKAHSGSVWKVCWAHPEFGQIVASCSFDRSVIVWEEEEPGKVWQVSAHYTRSYPVV
jgi:nucleoporin SEH1